MYLENPMSVKVILRPDVHKLIEGKGGAVLVLLYHSSLFERQIGWQRKHKGWQKKEEGACVIGVLKKKKSDVQRVDKANVFKKDRDKKEKRVHALVLRKKKERRKL